MMNSFQVLLLVFVVAIYIPVAVVGLLCFSQPTAKVVKLFAIFYCLFYFFIFSFSSTSSPLLSKCGNAGDINKNSISANDALVLTLCTYFISPICCALHVCLSELCVAAVAVMIQARRVLSSGNAVKLCFMCLVRQHSC